MSSQLRFTRSKHFTNLVLSSPFVLWFVFWMRIPHKEERFMVPVYPFIVLPAAFVLGTWWSQAEGRETERRGTTNSVQISRATSPSPTSPNNNSDKSKNQKSIGTSPSGTKRLLKFFCSVTLTLTIVLNVSRSLALWRYYGESDRAASFLYSHIVQQSKLESGKNQVKNKTVCVGKDWYRIPPSYFAPHNTRIKFVESSAFTGALPREFVENDENPTCKTSGPMNDLNEAAPGQSISLKDVSSQCDYVFDTTLGDGGEELRKAYEAESPALLKTKKTVKILRRGNILDASRSPWFARILYIPLWSDKHATWAQVIIASLT